MSVLQMLEELQSKYFVHQETIDFFKKRAESGFSKPYDEMSVSEARESYLKTTNMFAGTVDFNGTITDLNIPSQDVKGGIPVTVYKPRECRANPSILVYFHGGGNCFGSRESADSICKLLSKDASSLVLNVEYRLAPEHKFPSNNDDALCVVQWVMGHRQDVGGTSKSTIGVSGDSAGGRLAAVVCHEEPGVDYQILVYPNVDCAHDSTSHDEFSKGKGAFSNRRLVDWFMNLYFENQEDRVSLRGAPIRNDTKSFSKLPPALVIVAEIDPLRDNAILYHEKMKSAGVNSELMLVSGVIHAFFQYPGHYKEITKGVNERVVQFVIEHS